MANLGERLTSYMAEATMHRSVRVGLENAEKNQPYFGKTINDLAGIRPKEPSGSAIVIVGGPSLQRKRSVERIAASGFKGDIISADGSMGRCLRNDLVPNYIVTLDPDYLGYRIVRWFGDPEIETRPKDDYFRRQDLDPEHWRDERRTNRGTIDFVNRNGEKIKAIISTSAHPTVTKRCIESQMDLYWWSPIYDDYDSPNSITRKLFESNRIPCMTTGGNVGTSAWIFAHAVLKRKHVAIVGMDLGYAPGTPITQTQYYKELVEIFGNRAPEALISIHNPYLNEVWLTDPAYNWYRKIFIDLAREANCITYNCTEGGTLFGDPIRFIPLSEFLSKFAKQEKEG